MKSVSCCMCSYQNRFELILHSFYWGIGKASSSNSKRNLNSMAFEGWSNTIECLDIYIGPLSCLLLQVRNNIYLRSAHYWRKEQSVRNSRARSNKLISITFKIKFDCVFFLRRHRLKSITVRQYFPAYIYRATDGHTVDLRAAKKSVLFCPSKEGMRSFEERISSREGRKKDPSLFTSPLCI